MPVSVLLIALLLVGGYALFVWLRQHREARASARERSASRPALDTTGSGTSMIGSAPARPKNVPPPEMTADTATISRSLAAGTDGHAGRETGARSHGAAAPLGIGPGSREKNVADAEVVTTSPAPRRVRKREATVHISPEELDSITIDDEGTTLGVEAGAAREARRRVAVNTDIDLSVEISMPGDVESDDPSGPFVPVVVRAAGATHVGKKRKHNEDAIALDDERSVYVLADGMGGYAAGEVASQMCVDAIMRAYRTGEFGGEPIAGLPPRGDELVRAIQTSNIEILTESRNNEARAGMGTTVVAARFVPSKQRLYVAHVGDSRLYRLRKDEMVQLTTDHTLGQQGVTGPAAHKLSRAVGVFDEVEVDLNIDVPEPGDVYLICSDGLFKMVHELRIVEILSENPEPAVAAQILVDEANARGGKDNISVIVLSVAAADLRRSN